MPEPPRVSRRHVWIHLLLYPGHTLPTALAPVLVGVGLAVKDGVFAFSPAFFAFLCSWLVHVGGVFADNYALVTLHPRLREHPELNDALATGALDLAVLRRATVACFVLALAAGWPLLHALGPAAAGLGALGIATSFAYAAGPLPYARHGLADPVFLAMFGVVAVAGTYFAQAAAFGAPRLPASSLFVGLPVGALVVNVLVIDDLRDAEFDALKGWRTLPVRFGAKFGRAELAVLTLFAYLAPLAFWLALGLRPFVLLPLLTLPAAVLIARRVWTARGRTLLVPLTPRAAFLSLGYAALLGLGLALSR